MFDIFKPNQLTILEQLYKYSSEKKESSKQNIEEYPIAKDLWSDVQTALDLTGGLIERIFREQETQYDVKAFSADIANLHQRGFLTIQSPVTGQTVELLALSTVLQRKVMPTVAGLGAADIDLQTMLYQP